MNDGVYSRKSKADGKDYWYWEVSYRDEATGEARRLRRRAPVNTKVAATRARIKALEKISMGVDPDAENVGQRKLMSIVRGYVESCRHKRPGTYAQYKNQADVIEGHFGAMTVAQVTVEALMEFVAARRSTATADSTINNNLSLMQWACKASGLPSVFDTLKTKTDRSKVFPPRAAKHVFKRISDTDFELILSYLNTRFHNACRVAIMTGMRLEEICGMTGKEVRMGFFELPSTRTKNGRSRRVMITEDLPLPTAGPDELVYGVDGHSLSIAFRHAAIAAGVRGETGDGVRFHDLRHEFASRFMEAGGTPVECMAAGGWSSLAMVDRYASPGDERVKTVLIKMNKPQLRIVREEAL